MDQKQLRGLLEGVRTGEIEIGAALDRMQHLPFEELGYSKLDHHRALRHGRTEVVFGKGKTADQVAGIASRLLEKSRNLLITRANESIASGLKANFPETEYFPLSGAVRIWRDRTIHGKGKLAVGCAGPSDIPGAEGAPVTARIIGSEACSLYARGVTGLHR